MRVRARFSVVVRVRVGVRVRVRVRARFSVRVRVRVGVRVRAGGWVEGYGRWSELVFKLKLCVFSFGVGTRVRVRVGRVSVDGEGLRGRGAARRGQPEVSSRPFSWARARIMLTTWPSAMTAGSEGRPPAHGSRHPTQPNRVL